MNPVSRDCKLNALPVSQVMLRVIFLHYDKGNGRRLFFCRNVDASGEHCTDQEQKLEFSTQSTSFKE